MTGPLARAGAFFLAPETTSSTTTVTAAPPAIALAGVVAAPRDVAAAAGGIAAALRRQGRARAAVVLRHEWPEGPAIAAARHECSEGPNVCAAARLDGPGSNGAGHAASADSAARHKPSEGWKVCAGGTLALPAAARLARRLAARGVAAAAGGALVHVALPLAPEDAIREAWRVVGAIEAEPVVIALTGRSDELDAFLAQADRLYLATADDGAYGDLALASLAALGPPTDRVHPPTGAVARRAAARGLIELRPRDQEVPA